MRIELSVTQVSKSNAPARKGRLIVISGPSGVGKGTVVAAVMNNLKDLELSVSATTRTRRNHEVDEVDYHFLNRELFEAEIRLGSFYEYAEYNKNLYGTLRKTVENRLLCGIDLILEIDIQGARSVKRLDPTAVLIYMQPPSMQELERRLRDRKTETEETILERLRIASEEMAAVSEVYDRHYLITNNHVDSCAVDLEAIIRAERSRLFTNRPNSPAAG